jgi:hypothetical protein
MPGSGKGRKKQHHADQDSHGSNPESREPSMGGSQGTPQEARDVLSGRSGDRASIRSTSMNTREEGGYGADSGYSDGARTSERDANRDDSRSH